MCADVAAIDVALRQTEMFEPERSRCVGAPRGFWLRSGVLHSQENSVCVHTRLYGWDNRIGLWSQLLSAVWQLGAQQGFPLV